MREARQLLISVVTAVTWAAAAPRLEQCLHPQLAQAPGRGLASYPTGCTCKRVLLIAEVFALISLHAGSPSRIPVACLLPCHCRKHTREITEAVDRDSHLHKLQPLCWLGNWAEVNLRELPEVSSYLFLHTDYKR